MICIICFKVPYFAFFLKCQVPNQFPVTYANTVLRYPSNQQVHTYYNHIINLSSSDPNTNTISPISSRRNPSLLKDLSSLLVVPSDAVPLLLRNTSLANNGIDI
jgi:hypothetical protein